MAKLTSATESLDIRLGADTKLPISGSFNAIKGLDVLLQDIQSLLLTLPGERVMRPEFGCLLRAQIWENLESAEELGRASIQGALEDFEPRITLTSVTSESNENTGLITFSIKFIVNATDSAVNLIFPFRAVSQLSTA